MKQFFKKLRFPYNVVKVRNDVVGKIQRGFDLASLQRTEKSISVVDCLALGESTRVEQRRPWKSETWRPLDHQPLERLLRHFPLFVNLLVSFLGSCFGFHHKSLHSNWTGTFFFFFHFFLWKIAPDQVLMGLWRSLQTFQGETHFPSH